MNGKLPRYEPLVLPLAKGIDSFVETGTYRGATAAWATKHFSAVHSCELDRDNYNRAVRRVPGAKIFLGSSEAFLKRILPCPPSLFWLDAHWGGEKSGGAGRDNQCPLLDELRLIRESGGGDHVVLVDDIRLFEMVPPSIVDADQWPTLAEIFGEVNQWEGRFCQILGDVLFVVPRHKRDVFLRVRDNHGLRASASKYAWDLRNKQY